LILAVGPVKNALAPGMSILFVELTGRRTTTNVKQDAGELYRSAKESAHANLFVDAL